MNFELSQNIVVILILFLFYSPTRHNIGYVTRSQLHQCLTYLSLSGSCEDVDLLCQRFSDDTGFNYLKFLEELQPSEVQEQKYIQRIKQLKIVNTEKVIL